ncbi:MAG: efflux RND transporter periplasmic adaptor subunit [Planctomycetaceae bacterium]|nr:efflux RND transporter periplasmic adaptor subunit [Planctomycetaceae bacterium]
MLVTAEPWPTLVRVSGSMFADERAVVGAKVAGRVADVEIDLGDTVAANAALVALDRQEFELQVAQAQAQLEASRAAVGLAAGDPVEKLNPENAPPVREAEAVWNEARTKSQRWAQLRQQNAVTEADAEAVKAGEEVAAAKYSAAINGVREKIATISVHRAELALAQQRLTDAVVAAPFDGLVVERHVAPGAFVQVGDPIATIVRIDPLHFRGMVSERYARRLALGQPVEVLIESISEPRMAQVTRISPTLDPLSRALLFEAEVANPDRSIRAGLFAEAEITLNAESQAVVLPTSAVIEFAGVEKAWKVVDGITQEQVVATGERRDGQVVILDGVAAGDVVLVHAAAGRVGRVEPTGQPSADPSLTETAGANGTHPTSLDNRGGERVDGETP